MEGVVPGRDGERIWNTGTRIMLRLGAHGPGSRVPPGIVACGDEWLGERRNQTINKLKGNAKALEDAERELLMILKW